jgi:hypothetical protein
MTVDVKFSYMNRKRQGRNLRENVLRKCFLFSINRLTLAF